MAASSKSSTPRIDDRFKNWAQGLFEKNSETIKYVRDLLVLILLYGFLLAFMMSVLLPLKFPFGAKTILAFGIGFYFLKEEIPRIILKSQNRPK